MFNTHCRVDQGLTQLVGQCGDNIPRVRHVRGPALAALGAPLARHHIKNIDPGRCDGSEVVTIRCSVTAFVTPLRLA